MEHVTWAEITPANVLYAIVTFSTMITSILGWLQSKKNKTIAVDNSQRIDAKLETNTELTQKVAASVNGHLDGIKRENEDLRREVLRLQIAAGEIPTPLPVAKPNEIA